MAVTFGDKDNAEIRIQKFPRKLNPSLVVTVDGHTEIVAPFRGEYEARLFIRAMRKLMKGKKNG